MFEGKLGTLGMPIYSSISGGDAELGSCFDQLRTRHDFGFAPGANTGNLRGKKWIEQNELCNWDGERVVKWMPGASTHVVRKLGI